MNQSQICSTERRAVPEMANSPSKVALYQVFCFERSKGLEPLTF
jgi:hypothetical protein